ncbi:hypothetical protein J6590_056829 [Homalodisca vitripennis]|nr:hypothetical protein J6590_056829 [Homalodisca vitripennis]
MKRLFYLRLEQLAVVMVTENIDVNVSPTDIAHKQGYCYALARTTTIADPLALLSQGPCQLLTGQDVYNIVINKAIQEAVLSEIGTAGRCHGNGKY